MAPAGETRGSGGVFQYTAALLGLGVDQFGDLTLAHEGRRAGTSSGVLKENFDIFGARFSAINAIGRARLALNMPHDFERVAIVEPGGRTAGRVVDEQGHGSVVASRPRGGAGKDHVVHGSGAHGLVRGLAHSPAQCFQQVRLAAAVRADNTGQPALDQEIGRLNEGFETGKAQARDVQRGVPPATSFSRLGRRHLRY